MNNFEKIKKMSIDKMAQFIICQTHYLADKCPFNWDCGNCKTKLKQWLKAESEE